MSSTVDNRLVRGRMPGLGRLTKSLGLSRISMRYKIVVGGSALAVIGIGALFAPVIAPYDPIAQDISNAFSPPTTSHLFGTDQFGRDVLSRVIFAARLDLQIALVATVFCLIIGVLFGLIAGYRGGITDQVIGRLIDFVVAFPAIVAVIALIAFLGNDMINLYIALTITGWTSYARLVRGETFRVKALPYIDSARALGFSHSRIVMRHILPNVISPAGIYWITDMVGTILLVTSLSFLGLGPHPPTPEWGAMIAEARPFLLMAWWISVFPGLAIAVTGIALALLGDGLDEALSPRS